MPRQHSSGGKQRQGRISKQGDRYLGRLLVLGATAVIRHSRSKPTAEAGSKACSSAGPHGSSQLHRLIKRRGSCGLCWCMEKPIARRRQSQVAPPEIKEPHRRLPQLTGEKGDDGVMANRSKPELGRTRQALCAIPAHKSVWGARLRIASGPAVLRPRNVGRTHDRTRPLHPYQIALASTGSFSNRISSVNTSLQSDFAAPGGHGSLRGRPWCRRNMRSEAQILQCPQRASVTKRGPGPTRAVICTLAP
jgi:hypothetical protein